MNRYLRVCKEIGNPVWFLSSTGILVIGTAFFLYFYKFGQSNSLSGKTQTWAEFGDFFGGVTNPIIALLALIGLMVTIRLQQKEFKHLKNEMHFQNGHLSDQAAFYEKERVKAEAAVVLDHLLNEIYKLSERKLRSRQILKDGVVVDETTEHSLDTALFWALNTGKLQKNSDKFEDAYDELYQLLTEAHEILTDFVERYQKEISPLLKSYINRLSPWVYLCKKNGKSLACNTFQYKSYV